MSVIITKEKRGKKEIMENTREYNYEFGVTIGMCISKAADEGLKGNEMIERALEIFKLSIQAKTDPRFTEIFDEYWKEFRLGESH